MQNPLVALLMRWSVLALGVTLATKVIPGIRCDEFGTLLVVVLLLSFFNAILKPLLVLFALPFVLVSLGLGIWLINALLFMLVGRLVDGFVVEGFGAALLGAAIVSLTNMILLRLLGQGGPPPPRPPRGGGGGERQTTDRGRGGDVIDI